MAVTGRIPTYLNHSRFITARDVSVSKKRNVTKLKGAFGPIGLAVGQPDYEISVTCATPEDQAEFQQLADQGIDADQPESFSFGWKKGKEEYLATDCQISSDTLSSDQDSKADQAITIVAVTVERVA